MVGVGHACWIVRKHEGGERGGRESKGFGFGLPFKDLRRICVLRSWLEDCEG